jgi:cytochrome P450
MAVVLKKIPSELIGDMLGFPPQERPQWRTWFETWVAPATAPDERRQVHDNMLAYIDERLARSAEQQGDDFISRLVAAQRAGTVEAKEVRMLVFLLYAAGFDTTSNSMGFGILELLTHPEQADRLRGPETDWRLAVEEMFRVTTILHVGMSRIAKGGPIEVPSGRIAEGEGLIISLLAANYDPDVFPDAERFDVTRDARAQIGFSHGPHQCVGQQLARQEMYALLPRLMRRFPTLRLDAQVADLEFLPNGTRVVTSLPVAW